MRILMVLTSNSRLGNTNKKTGVWLEELAAAYYILADAGVNIKLASPNGGRVPIDPRSEEKKASTIFTERFYRDRELREELEHTEILNKINPEDYDAVYYPGGHGLMWDLVDDLVSIAIIETFYKLRKPMAFVCHGPAALARVKHPAGEPLVYGMSLTSFSNSEEDHLQLTNVVPFLVESELRSLGANYSNSNDGSAHVVKDGLLITGQNASSTEELAMS